MPPCVQYDDLWPGGPRFARSGAGFALGTDSVLLADFAADRRVRRFADLGCGAGVLTVLLLHALPQAAAVGVELQPDAAQLCRNNLEANGLTGRAPILCADLRPPRAGPPAGRPDPRAGHPPDLAPGGGPTLRVIGGPHHLTQEERPPACRIVSMSGADFIKTSTGFSSGGATVEDVKFFRERISPDVRVKAAGGIRTFQQAQAMLDAGADRIGASALVGLFQQEG